MQVFRAYFKIIKKNLPQLFVYIAVFLSLNIFLVKYNARNTAADFTDTKVNLAFFSDEEQTDIVKGLKTFLASHTTLVELKDEKETLQDALFFQDVAYIIRVPAGFAESFLAGKHAELQKTTIPNTAAAIHLDTLINRYLSTARLYVKGAPGISQAELVGRVARDLSIQTEVSYRTYGKPHNMLESMTFSFNYSAYVLLSLLILGVSSFMLVYNQPDLRRRNLCSPITLRSQNIQILLGNLVYALLCWAVMMGLNFALFGKEVFGEQVLVFALNALVFTVTSLSIGFLVGSVTRSRTVQAAISNAVTLGLSFIGGVFVPQLILGKTVLSLAQFLPTYWYVRANNEVGELSKITFDTLSPILGYMGIQLGIGVAVLAVALVITKQKQQSQTA